MQHVSSNKHGAARREGNRDDRHHRRSRRGNEGDDADDGHRRGSRDETKLTKEEEQLYAKAKEFLKRNEIKTGDEMEEKDERHRRHHRRSRKHSDRRHHHREDDSGHRHRHHRRSSRNNEDEDDDESNERRSRRHRREKSEKHKHSRHQRHHHHRHGRQGDDKQRDDDVGDDNGVRRHSKRNKRTHTIHTVIHTGDEEFKNKASPIDNPSDLCPLGKILGHAPVDEKKLDVESDYFSHNAHLRLYLYRSYGIYFEDLTSLESHCAFAEFTKLYNSGSLEEAYYSDNNYLPQEAMDQCSRTKHKWTFRTNKLEEKSLQLVRAGVKKQTEYTAAAANLGMISTTTERLGVSLGAATAEAPTSQANTTNNDQRKPFDYAQTVAGRRQADKAHSERIKLANEEIHGIPSGKADTGWERMREKKRERSEKLHGAHQDRESEGLELDDDDIYGTSAGGGASDVGSKRRGGGRGDVSFEEALAKERQFRERKEAESAARRAGLLEKEAERQKKMFEALGLSGMMRPGEKITIAPRNDTTG